MQIKVLNYRVIITPDVQTGTKKFGYTAFCPTLGVADDGDTIDEALINVQGAIQTYIKSLSEDGEEIPVDNPARDFITITQIPAPSSYKFA